MTGSNDRVADLHEHRIRVTARGQSIDEADQLRGAWADLVAVEATRVHDVGMSDVTRHEMDARLDATEARVASTLSEMKSEMAGFRADMREGLAGLREELASVRTDHAKDQVAATRWQVGLIAAILLGAAATTATVIVRTAPNRAPVVQPIVVPAPATPANPAP